MTSTTTSTTTTLPAFIQAAKLLTDSNDWQRPLARLWDINSRVVRRWASGAVPVPPWAWLQMQVDLALKAVAFREAAFGVRLIARREARTIKQTVDGDPRLK